MVQYRELKAWGSRELITVLVFVAFFNKLEKKWYIIR
jgi:hypothetical protein